MRPILVARMLAAVVFVVAAFLLPSALLGYIDGELWVLWSFLLPAGIAGAGGGLILLLTRGTRGELGTRAGFIVVTLSWIACALVGALPFYISGAIPSFTDAFFESMSGFTTTGASILTEIESLPRGILLWRSTTHWLGGMGIIVLSVAVFPLIGIGGGQLVKAEAPWPTVDKVTPRIAQTAKILWLIYFGLTVGQTLLLLGAGMDLFDSVTHTFGTLATGGFSPKNASVGHYDSALVDGIITVFMVLAGTNFLLHFALITGRLDKIRRDTEFKSYLLVFFTATLAITVALALSSGGSFSNGFRLASFQVASILTTTGFATADYEMWPQVARVVLFCLMFVGGCAGSTGGGIKVARIVTLFKQAMNEFRYLTHPRGIFPISFNRVPMARRMVFAISAFVFLYVLLLLLSTMVIALAGVSILTALSTALATLGNIGPGFDAVGPTQNYAFFPQPLKWFLSFLMMTGRLEIYTVMVMFTPGFWKS